MGFTEIYVYSNVVFSHHVGDAFAPFSRAVPAKNKNPDEIVKQYNRSLLFPLKIYVLEIILIELRT